MVSDAIASRGPEQALFLPTWMADGVASETRTYSEFEVLVTPLIQRRKMLCPGMSALHSLVVDSNLMIDLEANCERGRESSRPDPTPWIEWALHLHGMELNFVQALIERWQNDPDPERRTAVFCRCLRERFGVSDADADPVRYTGLFSQHRASIRPDMDRFVGFVPIILFLLQTSKRTAQQNLLDLFGIIEAADASFFLIHFYYAALLFLFHEQPKLFHQKDQKKLAEDLKIGTTKEKIDKSIFSISIDLSLLATPLFSVGLPPDVLLFPYFATRDRSLQLLLSEIECEEIHDAGKGQANGRWVIRKGGLLDKNLGDTIESCLRRRSQGFNHIDIAARRNRLDALSEVYRDKLVALRRGMNSPALLEGAALP